MRFAYLRRLGTIRQHIQQLAGRRPKRGELAHCLQSLPGMILRMN